MKITELLPPSVRLDDEHSCLRIIDQTLLPGQLQIIALRDIEQIHTAIYRLQVRGAPAIGIAAAYGLYLAMKHSTARDKAAFCDELQTHAAYLNSARPTAVNLAWALKRLCACVDNSAEQQPAALKQVLYQEAVHIEEEDIATCHSIGEHGAALLQDGFGVLTHCNAGHLATSRYGTALAPVYLALEQGRSLKLYCDETRPLLQGARLTAFELMQVQADVTLLCDNMAAGLLAAGKIQAVLVGADRIAANGDAANKTGTLSLAVNAHYFGVPFYVCAPCSTIDAACATGSAIPIEHRPAQEVTEAWYSQPMAPPQVAVYNPAFDVTPAKLITAIITERGVCRPPYAFC